MAASNSEMEGLSLSESPSAEWAADDIEKRERLRATMEAAGITAVSIATVAGGKVSSHGEFDVPDRVTGKSVAVDKNTVFGAASLSKPLLSGTQINRSKCCQYRKKKNRQIYFARRSGSF